MRSFEKPANDNSSECHPIFIVYGKIVMVVSHETPVKGVLRDIFVKPGQVCRMPFRAS